MYATSKIIPITRRITPQQAASSMFLGLFCCAIILFLIVATVVLALIPIYLSTKSITIDPDALQTQEITMYIEVEQNHQVVSVRKRRDVGDLYYIVNGTFGQEGLDMIKQTFLSVLLTKSFVKDVSIFNASLAYYDQIGRRRRHSVPYKRQAYPKIPIILIIQFRIIFTSDCFYTCQSSNSPTLRELLFTIDTFHIVYTNVPIYENGIFFLYAPRIEYVAIIYISAILPARDPTTELDTMIGQTMTTTGLTMTTTGPTMVTTGLTMTTTGLTMTTTGPTMVTTGLTITTTGLTMTTTGPTMVTTGLTMTTTGLTITTTGLTITTTGLTITTTLPTTSRLVTADIIG